MLYLATLMLLLFQAPATPDQAADVKADVPAEPPTPQYLEGPLKIEVTAVREVRTEYYEDPERGAKESNFAFQARISGADLKRVKRIGNLILTDIQDDTGQQLADPNQYTEQDKTSTRPQNQPVQRLEAFGLLVGGRANLSKREATHIKHLRGTIKLVLAEDTKSVTILDPLSHVGEQIQDPRLDELGVEVQVVRNEELERPVPGSAYCILRVGPDDTRLAGIKFYDADMREIRTQSVTVNTKDGRSAQAFIFSDVSALNDQLQAVLDVYPNAETVELKIDAEDVPLP